jgi:glycerophosphoryl diester phosphodiesterase
MRLSSLTRTVAASAATASLLLAPTSIAAAGDRWDHDDGPGYDRGWRSTYVEPTLVGRATLSADFLAEGPPSGAEATPANGREGPWDGQVIPGFSAMVDNGNGTFWAQPDNGFGSKANSRSFLLRVYRVRADFETAAGGGGDV